MKIIKHCQEESAAGTTNEVQGVLLGLVTEGRLEVTNCFPFPRHTEEDDMDDSKWPTSFIKLVSPNSII